MHSLAALVYCGAEVGFGDLTRGRLKLTSFVRSLVR